MKALYKGSHDFEQWFLNIFRKSWLRLLLEKSLRLPSNSAIKYWNLKLHSSMLTLELNEMYCPIIT